MTTATLTRKQREERFKKATKNYWRGHKAPLAWGLGYATMKRIETEEGTDHIALDARFVNINFDPEHESDLLGKSTSLNTGSLAAVLRAAAGSDFIGTTDLCPEDIRVALTHLDPYTDDPREEHANIAALEELAEMLTHEHLLDGYYLMPVLYCLDSLEEPATDAIGAYFRLHLLSERFVQPHGVNLDGVFGLLSNNCWTEYGPILPGDVPALRSIVRRKYGKNVPISSIDKFPRMTDYVVPSGVRIADADRVRLGAHLASGTTVMHEGFVNFNAGTLGKSMVEGRISAGVVVGDGTDIGGGASIMGTLSGGGEEVISVGKRCLLGANSGIGISLGDECVVEAGLYLTAGTKVCHGLERKFSKASELGGHDRRLFLRNSTTGVVEMYYRWGNKASVELNAELHAN